MSFNFNANQYEQPFYPNSLQNWEVPRLSGRHPNTRVGCSRVISTNEGHLLTGVSRSRQSPWGSFVGTWDMPTKIPGNNITNHTARADHAINKHNSLKEQGDLVLSGQLKPSKVPEPLPVKADQQAEVKPVASVTDVRSGAANPIPATTSPTPGSPNSVNWPLPSHSRNSVKQTTPKPASPIQPVTFPLGDKHGDFNQSGQYPVMYSSRTPVPQNDGEVAWQLPKSVEPGMA